MEKWPVVGVAWCSIFSGRYVTCGPPSVQGGPRNVVVSGTLFRLVQISSAGEQRAEAHQSRLQGEVDSFAAVPVFWSTFNIIICTQDSLGEEKPFHRFLASTSGHRSQRWKRIWAPKYRIDTIHLTRKETTEYPLLGNWQLLLFYAGTPEGNLL